MQFKNELLMRNDYKYYYLYYFNKYKEQYVNINEEKSKLIKKISFIEFLMSNITEGIKGKEEKNSYLENLANEFDEEKFEYIKQIYEETKNDSNIIIEYGINFDDEYDDSIVYMKAFYQNFLKKLKFPEYSEDVKFILDYFNNFQDKLENLEKAPLVKEKEETETKAIKNLKNIFNNLQKYAKKNDKDNVINDLSSNLDIMEKFILTNRKIYIPFIGVSSAGKSTTLNGIVGYKLFPESLNECTTRGIIIEYSDVIELSEMKIDSNKNYYVFNEKNKVAEGYKQVREYLESLNARYGRNEDHFFYKVKTTIKAFEDLGFDEELKKRVLLIDLPGPDTKENTFNNLYKSERTPYEKLLLISSSFIFVNKGRAIKSTENKEILNKLYNNIQITSSLSNYEYLKACFFVINAFNNLNEDEINLTSINEDLASILFNKNDPMFETCKKEIKSSIFNARNFYYYLRESTLLKDNEALIGQFLQEYLNQDETNTITFKSKSFPKFCLKNLELKLKDLGFNIDNTIRKQKCEKEFLNEINEIFKKSMTTLNAKIEVNDNKIINDIANILYYVKDENNIKKNMLAYKNSFSEEFLKQLKKQIQYSKEYKDKDYKKKLKEILKYFDAFFESNREKPSSNTIEELKKIKNDFDKELEDILYRLNVNIFFKETENSIKDETKKQKDLAQQYLNEKKSDDEILNIVNKKMKKYLDLLQEKINNRISDFNVEIKNFTDKVKRIIPNFNQDDVNKINEKYNNYFNKLLSVNEKIVFNNSELSRTLFSWTLEYLYSWKLYFKKFFNSNIIIEKIDNLEYYLLEDLRRRKRTFNFKTEDQCIKIKDNFKSIFNLSFSDLSVIEEKEWEQSKKLYYEAKKSLLSNEKTPEEEIEIGKGEEDKTLLIFQDISCFGQSSSSVTIPIISACGIQTAILPGALLSNPISKYFSGFYSNDLKNNIPEIINQWIKEKIKFDAFYTDNIIKNQIPFIIEIMKKLAKPNCLRIIDPSMTDNSSIDKNFIKELTNLLKEADYILPNITEACLLLGFPYIQENYDKNFIKKISKELAKFGIKNIIITGISFEKRKIGASVYHSENDTFEYYFNEFIEGHFHGIGNLFSSVFAGAILNGKSDIESIKLAADFVVAVIKNTNNNRIKDRNGIKFEKYLPNLMKAFEKE